jgi:hypothetical protein
VVTASAIAAPTSRDSASPRARTQTTGCEKRAQSVVSMPFGDIAARNWASVITAYLARRVVPPTTVSR